jgi:hypothetical protein
MGGGRCNTGGYRQSARVNLRSRIHHSRGSLPHQKTSCLEHEGCDDMPTQRKIDEFLQLNQLRSQHEHDKDEDKENRPPAKRRRIIIHDSDSDCGHIQEGSVIEQLGLDSEAINNAARPDNHLTEETMAAPTHASDIRNQQHVEAPEGEQVQRAPRTIHTETVTPAQVFTCDSQTIHCLIETQILTFNRTLFPL